MPTGCTTVQGKAENYAADLSTDPGVLAGVVTEFVLNSLAKSTRSQCTSNASARRCHTCPTTGR